MPERIGLYGGTFDPVHHGHLILARDAAEQLMLDRVLFIPAAVSPHRTDLPPTATQAQRLAMLQMAVAVEPRFVVDECELHRPEPSYTFDTVKQVESRYPGARLYLLLGADQLPRFPTWHRFMELRSIITFVVFNRAIGAEEVLTAAYPTLRRRLDISATEMRKRVASGLSIRYLVPGEVADYIEKHQLYREANPP